MDFSFQSKQLLFRKIRSEDKELYLHLYTDAEIMQYIAPPFSPNTAERFFNVAIKPWSFSSSRSLIFTVFEKSSEQKIGICSVTTRNAFSKQGEVGVMFKKKYQSKGLGTELLKALTGYCFLHLNYNKLWGPPLPHNIKSVGILENTGYFKEATLRQHLLYEGNFIDTPLYTMLKEEYLDKYSCDEPLFAI